MSSGQSLFEAFGVMMICLMMGFYLTMTMGVGVDQLRNMFLTSGFYNVPGVWAGASNAGNIDVINALIYAIIYFIPVFGVVNFTITAVRRQRYDQYGNPLD